MFTDKLTDYFLPAAIRNNKAHPRYDEFHVLTSSFVVGHLVMGTFGIFLYLHGKALFASFLFIWCLISVVVLFSIKYLSHYRIPMGLIAIFAYYVTYFSISETGLIYSPFMTLVHMYLLAAEWTDKRWGWLYIFSNLALIGFIYYESKVVFHLDSHYSVPFGNLEYVVGVHVIFTAVFGAFFGHQQLVQDKDRRKIKEMQDKQITLLDKTVKQRTDQLNNMRQVMAADFHDYTGNALSAIIRQASMLKIQLQQHSAMLPMVESIIQNGNDLYASSKDFLWNLNHDSDDPVELFDYLTGFGQSFYNQFDMAFSSRKLNEEQGLPRLDPFSALNIIFIFKEAMTNVVKHATASEVELSMFSQADRIVYALVDNGTWKQPGAAGEHYGLQNIRKRSVKNNFEFKLSTSELSTRIEVAVPYSGGNFNNSYHYEQENHHN